MPSRHAMHPYNKEIAKCERHVSEDVKAHIDRTLKDLLGTVVGSVSTELNQDADSKKKNKFPSICNNNNQGHLQSICPTHDKIKNDTRLKAYWEV